MRLSLISAGAALTLGLALSACSGGTGSTPAMPSAGAQAFVAAGSHVPGLTTRIMPGVKILSGPTCNTSVYVFCIVVTPGNSGPYIETSAGSGYELYNNAYILTAKKGKPAKKFSTYFSPDPGNPTYQYITYSGKPPKKATKVKWSDYYCIGFSPSACTGNTYTFIIGISLS